MNSETTAKLTEAIKALMGEADSFKGARLNELFKTFPNLTWDSIEEAIGDANFSLDYRFDVVSRLKGEN